jgi:hypothetical protein
LSFTQPFIIMHAMDPFRDDRTTLLARITRLEAELSAVRDADEREKLSRDLAALARRVADASVAPAPFQPWRAGALGVALVVVAAAVGFTVSRKHDVAFVPGAAVGADVPGFPHDVEPAGVLPIARANSGLGPSARLTQIAVSYVRSTGLVDLRAATYQGSVVYSFAEPPPPAAAPAASAPLGAPPPLRPLGHSASVEVDALGVHGAPLALSWTEEGVADPRCSVADVWRAAIAAGAPADAVAVVHYGKGFDVRTGAIHEIAQWTLEITGTSYRYEIDDATCAVMK